MIILAWLVEFMGTIVGQVLLALGVSYLSYKGFDSMIASAKASFFTSLGGVGGSVVGLLGLMKVDVAVNMVCSALVGRLTIAGMTSGVMKKMVLK